MISRADLRRLSDSTTDLPVSWVDPRGYVILRAPDHMPADSSGGVARHRAVLWDSLGITSPHAATTPCAFCSWMLPWKVEPQLGAHRYVVNVDHINSVPGDDRPDNLRALCFWCNSNREYAEARMDFKALAKLFRRVAPWDRPTLKLMVDLIACGNSAHKLSPDDGLEPTDAEIADAILAFIPAHVRMHRRGPSGSAIRCELGDLGFRDQYQNKRVLEDLKRSGKVQTIKAGSRFEHFLGRSQPLGNLAS